MRKYTLIFNAIIGFLVCSSATSLALNYRLEMLGTLGGQSSAAYGINDHGQIVGYAHTPGYTTRAFLYENGVMINIDTLGGLSSVANDINNAGQIVGDMYTSSYQYHAFFYENGVMNDIGTLGGNECYANAINDAGQVVGYSSSLAGPSYAYLYENGTMVNINPVRAAYGINNNGEIVGYSYHPGIEATYHCGDIDNEIPVSYLGAIDGDWSWAWDINDQGQIVGQSETSIPGEYHAFLYENGVMNDLGTIPNGDSSFALAINNKGMVVGKAWDPSGRMHAFLCIDDEMLDLNSLIDPEVDWTLAVAYDINEYGDIVGTALSPDLTVGRAFLLYNEDADRSLPIPEPLTLVLLIASLFGLYRRFTRVVV